MGSDSLFMCDSKVEFYCRKNALQIAAASLRQVLDHLVHGIRVSSQIQRLKLPMISLQYFHLRACRTSVEFEDSELAAKLLHYEDYQMVSS